MEKCFDQSHAAYGRGDNDKTKELTNEGHLHKQRMERLNKEASDWIYQVRGAARVRVSVSDVMLTT